MVKRSAGSQARAITTGNQGEITASGALARQEPGSLKREIMGKDDPQDQNAGGAAARGGAPACAHCGIRTAELMKCARCLQDAYCSKE